MQSTASGFTVEERNSTRSIASSLLVSWKKDTNLSAITFTIGVSAIGGDDLIGINQGAIGSPSNYVYFDESNYLISLAWERGLNMPMGGLSKAMAEATLDNTSNRFLPDYMGGNSELFTAILPRRPFIINSGFNYNGIDQMLPQVTGITTKQLDVDRRNAKAKLVGSDYLDFFQNRYVDKTAMWTNSTTDTIIESILTQQGLSTSQYDLDTGINIVPFALFEKGTKLSDIIGELVEAENGHFYQDEIGKFYFRNRQWGDTSPYNQVQKTILTSQVINASVPNTDHIVNVVEVTGKPRKKQPRQLLFKLSSPIRITPDENYEMFIEFEDPVIQVDTVNFKSNVTESSTTDSGIVYLKSQDTFAKAMKLVFATSAIGYINSIEVFGRPARNIAEVYTRLQDDSSVTAYEERPVRIENDYIQDQTWAESFAQMILNDFSNPESLQTLTIRALPSLQLYDLISWQGKYWRVFNIRNTIDSSQGYVQELTLLQRTITSYFRIGISSIGGTDNIAP